MRFVMSLNFVLGENSYVVDAFERVFIGIAFGIETIAIFKLWMRWHSGNTSIFDKFIIMYFFIFLTVGILSPLLFQMSRILGRRRETDEEYFCMIQIL